MPQGPARRWILSCDYGTVNPTSMGLWGEYGGVWYRVAEYYYDARQARRQQTDQEYAQRLAELAGGRAIEAVVVEDVYKRQAALHFVGDEEDAVVVADLPQGLHPGDGGGDEAALALEAVCLLYTSRCV